MIVVTTEDGVGQRIVRTHGQVFGLVVRSRGLGGNLVADLRSIIGGEIHEYTAMVEDARRQAIGWSETHKRWAVMRSFG